MKIKIGRVQDSKAASHAYRTIVYDCLNLLVTTNYVHLLGEQASRFVNLNALKTDCVQQNVYFTIIRSFLRADWIILLDLKE